MESIAVSLFAGDSHVENLTMDTLASKTKGTPRLMQTCISKLKLLHWFFEELGGKIHTSAASGAEETLTADA